MSKALYPVFDGVTHKGKKMYTVLGSLTEKVKKGYVVRGNFSRRTLPSGYTQVEYIASSGTQHIDTGFVPDNNTRVVMDAQLTTSGSIATWFGARKSATSNNYAFIRTTAGDTFRSDYNNVYTQTWTADDSVRHVVDKNAETTTFAGTTQSYTNAAFRCPCNMTLFAMNQAGTIQWYAVMKLYSCQIYDNGTLARDYVACVDANGEVGLYDMANGVFYKNAGTGTFVAGSTYKNITRLFFSAYTNSFVSYSGAYTTSEITDDAGVPYVLYTLTGSGNLVLSGDVQFWMCGGGGKGNTTNWHNADYYKYYITGGGGGGGYVFDATLSEGEYTITIGAGNGGGSLITQRTATLATAEGGSGGIISDSGSNGGSGGGGGSEREIDEDGDSYISYGAVGQGAGVSTIPFGITTLRKHCAGGAGGNQRQGSYGGAGGSNGSDGSLAISSQAESADYGGGVGGSRGAGGAATFYGSGGGGGGENGSNYQYGGTGYQGVAYVLVPAA